MKSAFFQSRFALAAALFFSLARMVSGVESLERAESVDSLMEKGKVFEDKLKANEALTYYLAAEQQAPKNARLLVRIARLYRYLMTDAPSNGEKLRWGHKALEYSERAAAAAPDSAEA